MKRIVMLFALVVMLLSTYAMAKDVQVDGYYRKDGTYVAPHTRSAPDGSKANNYGPSTSSSQYSSPITRDYDNDGTPNTTDQDDDNDGTQDDQDDSQYGSDD